MGDTFTPEIYMWASQCQANDITGLRAVTVNVTSPNCTRMASLLDTLIKDKSMSTQSVFSTALRQEREGQGADAAGPGLVRRAVFDTVRPQRTRRAQIAAAPLPQWPGDVHPDHRRRGRRHLAAVGAPQHLKAAVRLHHLGDDHATPTRSTWRRAYPAYAPAATGWLAKQAKTGYFASDMSPALTQAAGEVWSGWGYGKFSQEAIWAATVTRA